MKFIQSLILLLSLLIFATCSTYSDKLKQLNPKLYEQITGDWYILSEVSYGKFYKFTFTKEGNVSIADNHVNDLENFFKFSECNEELSWKPKFENNKAQDNVFQVSCQHKLGNDIFYKNYVIKIGEKTSQKYDGIYSGYKEKLFFFEIYPEQLFYNSKPTILAYTKDKALVGQIVEKKN